MIPVTEAKKITATILGEKQLDTFAVMCFLARRRPHEMVNDVLLDAIRAGQRDPMVQRMVRDMKRREYGIRIAAASGG